jgi:hypothetical protein
LAKTIDSIRPIDAVRVNHINVVLEGYDAMVEHFARLYGGQVVMDLPQDAWHACIMDVGRVLFELFAPHEFFLHTRAGPHFLGIEYQIEDLAHAREVIAARGLRVARELGVALHTHPADCHGVSLELFEGYFHDNDELLQVPMRPAEHWRDEHPLGLTGLHGCTIAVTDLAQAVEDFEAILHHDALEEGPRPAVAGTAVALHVGDAWLELIAPDGEGPLREHLVEHGEGIRSTVFRVRDLDQARRCFGDQGIELVAGAAPGSFAISAEQNLGVIFEFIEGDAPS